MMTFDEMPAGWTVAAVLGHLAFWDQRVQVVLDMVEEGVSAPTTKGRWTA